MLKPLMATITQSVAALDFKKLTGTNADADDAMKRFLADEQDRSLTQFKSDLPLLADAIAKAYSRRFNEIQLSDLKSFFDTPSGRVYVRESMSMMTDPDVMNVQTAMITKSFEGFQVRLALLVREIKTRKRPAGS